MTILRRDRAISSSKNLGSRCQKTVRRHFYAALQHEHTEFHSTGARGPPGRAASRQADQGSGPARPAGVLRGAQLGPPGRQDGHCRLGHPHVHREPVCQQGRVPGQDRHADRVAGTPPAAWRGTRRAVCPGGCTQRLPPGPLGPSGPPAAAASLQAPAIVSRETSQPASMPPGSIWPRSSPTSASIRRFSLSFMASSRSTRRCGPAARLFISWGSASVS